MSLQSILVGPGLADFAQIGETCYNRQVNITLFYIRIY